MEIHLTATQCHLPYGITQCYLPPDTSEYTRLYPSQTGWYSIYRPIKDGGLSKPNVVRSLSVCPSTTPCIVALMVDIQSLSVVFLAGNFI